MACPHGNTRGRCQGCREDELERYFGVPEDHIDDEEGDA